MKYFITLGIIVLLASNAFCQHDLPAVRVDCGNESQLVTKRNFTFSWQKYAIAITAKKQTSIWADPLSFAGIGAYDPYAINLHLPVHSKHPFFKKPVLVHNFILNMSPEFTGRSKLAARMRYKAGQTFRFMAS